MRYFLAALLFAMPALAKEYTITVPSDATRLVIDLADPKPAPKVVCEAFDVELQPGDSFTLALRELGTVARVCVRVHRTHGRLAVEQSSRIGELVIVGAEGARLDCTEKAGWVAAKGCIAAQGGRLGALAVHNLTIGASVMIGGGSRGIHIGDFPLHLENVTFDGCEETCVQGGSSRGNPKPLHAWTMKNVTILNGNTTVGDNVLYSSESVDGVWTDHLSEWVIEGSTLQGVESQVVKTCHASTIIRNTKITSARDGPEIHNACAGYMLLENVEITTEADSGSRWIIAVGNRNKEGIQSTRCSRFDGMVPLEDKPFRTVEFRNVTITDNDTAYTAPASPRIVDRCDIRTRFIDGGGNTYNGQPIDFDGVARK